MVNIGKELNKTWQQRVYSLTEERDKLRHKLGMKNTV